MKKYLLFVFLAPMLFFSCSKDHKTTPVTTVTGAKTYKVQFNLSGFSDQIIANAIKPKAQGVTTNSADTSSSDSLNVLYYLVYNSNFKYLHKIVLNSTSGSFANISDNLPSGTYNLYFVAGKTGLVADTVNSQFYYGTSPADSSGSWHDTFYTNLQLTVTGSTVKSVVLSRFVSELKINITDAIPANAVKITTTIQYEYNTYNFGIYYPGFGYRYTKVLSTTITQALVGTTNLQQYTIMGNTHYPLTVVISSYDASNNLIGGATIDNVMLQPNTETILSGTIYNHAANGTVTNVSVNNTWGPTTTISFNQLGQHK